MMTKRASYFITDFQIAKHKRNFIMKSLGTKTSYLLLDILMQFVSNIYNTMYDWTNR